MMSKRFVSLIVLAVFLCPAVAAAQGTAGSQFLGIGMGARAMGMGGASVSVVNDGSSLYWNPAGLAGMTSQSASISHVSWLDGAVYQYATFVSPLGSSYVGLALEQGGDRLGQHRGRIVRSERFLGRGGVRPQDAPEPRCRCGSQVPLKFAG